MERKFANSKTAHALWVIFEVKHLPPRRIVGIGVVIRVTGVLRVLRLCRTRVPTLPRLTFWKEALACCKSVNHAGTDYVVCQLSESGVRTFEGDDGARYRSVNALLRCWVRRKVDPLTLRPRADAVDHYGALLEEIFPRHFDGLVRQYKFVIEEEILHLELVVHVQPAGVARIAGKS